MSKPQFWLRAVIVACGVAGLLMGEQRLIYFTAQSNLLTLAYFVGALFWMVRRGTTEAPAPRWRGAVTLWILITGLISHFMLNHGADPLPGLAAADPLDALTNRSLFLVHYVVPVLVLVDWVAFGPHRVVRWRDVPLWIAYPLGYGLMIEARGALLPAAPVRFPYFFLDPTSHGYGWVALQFVQLAVIFGLLGLLVVGLDRLAALAGTQRAPRPALAEQGPASGPVPATRAAKSG
jgi:hypothetical protein